MNIFLKAIKHFHVVNKHRWYVFMFSIKAGIPWRGFIHDLSKYSPTEFFESVKYFDGHRSPIHYAKMDKGYSKAWLHHKGKNKHHFEYWEDIGRYGRYGSIMPYKYAVESICDKLGAGKAYNKDFNYSQPLEYWNKVDKNSPTKIHPVIENFTDIILNELSENGIKILNKKHLKEVYNKEYNKYYK